MDPRFLIAVALGKSISFLIKLQGGGATAAPGYYALKIDPDLTRKLASGLAQNIIVSGTNGKTTTARLISDILTPKYQIIHNRQGSNLTRGLASTLIKNFPLPKNEKTLGLWEVDEAALKDAVSQTRPKVIVLLNLFRDQLDRYGEVNSLRANWQKVVASLAKDTILILNADDPGIAYLAKSAKCKVLFFGVGDGKIDLPQVTDVADTRYCPSCSRKLVFDTQFSSHMGRYHCSNCSFKRPQPQILASSLKFNPDFSTRFDLTLNSRLSTLAALQDEPRLWRDFRLSTINYQLPGLYNAYNVLAAISVGQALEFSLSEIESRITDFSAAFGRFQKISVGDKHILLFLVKNPAGANEVIRTLTSKNNLNLLAILNDNFADGRDVSWIWDSNWEILSSAVKNVSVSGIRSWDLANRLKYAGFKLDKNSVYQDINYSIQKSLENLSNNDTLIILPTYTALLEVQKSLNKLGGNLKWHQD